MNVVPMPVDEAERLRAVDSLGPLSSTRDAFTDSVALAAAGIVGTSMSAITVIDTHHAWVGSTCNLPFGAVPRSVAFCSHTVLGQEPLVVPDTWLDPRFAANPAVVGPPWIRFYAGFPLVVAGRSVGALCVVDDLPRVLSAEQSERLAHLAVGTAVWLSIKRVVPA